MDLYAFCAAAVLLAFAGLARFVEGIAPHVMIAAGSTSAVLACTDCANAVGVPTWLSPVLCALFIALINVAVTEYRHLRAKQAAALAGKPASEAPHVDVDTDVPEAPRHA